MSYEGHEQHICENGHLFTTEPQWQGSEEVYKCHCGALSAFSNSVDDTNCESHGIIPDDAWKKLQLLPEIREVCNLGHSHVLREATYRIPTRAELPELQHRWDSENQTFFPLALEEVLTS